MARESAWKCWSWKRTRTPTSWEHRCALWQPLHGTSVLRLQSSLAGHTISHQVCDAKKRPRQLPKEGRPVFAAKAAQRMKSQQCSHYPARCDTDYPTRSSPKDITQEKVTSHPCLSLIRRLFPHCTRVYARNQLTF